MGNLVPSSAESLTRRVGSATDAGGPVVPEVPAEVLARYEACGRVAALGLVNGHPLGCRFGRYFLRLAFQRGTPGAHDA